MIHNKDNVIISDKNDTIYNIRTNTHIRIFDLLHGNDNPRPPRKEGRKESGGRKY